MKLYQVLIVAAIAFQAGISFGGGTPNMLKGGVNLLAAILIVIAYAFETM